ncbi:MAG: DUF2254 domain-containing protein [Bacillota bacterium]
MKKFLDNLKTKVYVPPLIFIVAFALLSLMVVLVDRSIVRIPEALQFPRAFLQSMLLMTIGGILTVVTITFSSIMVVLTTYSGQFSPRTLNDFLIRKVPLRILGFFLGMLVYSTLVLTLSFSIGHTFFPVSTLVSTLLLIISFILFAYYIHYVSKSIQINHYIDSLVNKAIKDIRAYQTSIEEDPSLVLKTPEQLEKLSEKKGTPYHASQTGYITDYNVDKFIEYAKEKGIEILVEKPVGAHVFEEDTILNIFSDTSVQADKETIDEWITLSNEPSPYSEYLSSAIKLTEIAVRALSPGVNDPATAMHCIQQIGYILKTLSDSHQNLVYQDEDGVDRLIMQGINFDQLLYDTFYQIKLYGTKDYKVIQSVLTSFARIAKEAGYFTKRSLWNFAKYVMDDIPYRTLSDYDYKALFRSLYQLAILTNHVEDYKKTYNQSKEDEEELKKNEAIEK